MSAHTCVVNAVPADEDLGAPFRVTYRPCGRHVVAVIDDRVPACAEHADEAERMGCDVEREEPES